jgi:hypothetical protein
VLRLLYLQEHLQPVYGRGGGAAESASEACVLGGGSCWVRGWRRGRGMRRRVNCMPAYERRPFRRRCHPMRRAQQADDAR